MMFRNLSTGTFFVGLWININRPLGLNSPPLLHNKRKCNHATKNTPGHAHAISVPNRDFFSGSSPDTLFAKLADRVLPDTSPTHPHPAHPAQHTCRHINQQPRCEYIYVPESRSAALVLAGAHCRYAVYTASTLYNICTLAPGAGCPSLTHILITYNHFGGLLALFLMATKELKSSGATKCAPHITINRSLMPVFPCPMHESFPFFPGFFCPWETSGCLYHHGWN